MVDECSGGRLGQHPGRSAEPVDLTAVIAGCAERARIADPERAWRVRVEAGLDTVGDEELLRRAVDNLLMNVLVHTPASTIGTITAEAARAFPHGLRIRLSLPDYASPRRIRTAATPSSTSA